MSDEITDLERSLLSVILKDSHRPAAITRILQGRHVECDQNTVVHTLNELEKKGLVERFTTKTWIATSKAEKLFS
ncbi:MAG: hypothetical protein K9W43_03405 [Candidatus Thorarchaeota archaeon]|nr:hypothetical protein [Candidatus Thorarchaeota archaeon]